MIQKRKKFSKHRKETFQNTEWKPFKTPKMDYFQVPKRL